MVVGLASCAFVCSVVTAKRSASSNRTLDRPLRCGQRYVRVSVIGMNRRRVRRSMSRDTASMMRSTMALSDTPVMLPARLTCSRVASQLGISDLSPHATECVIPHRTATRPVRVDVEHVAVDGAGHGRLLPCLLRKLAVLVDDRFQLVPGSHLVALEVR